MTTTRAVDGSPLAHPIRSGKTTRRPSLLRIACAQAVLLAFASGCADTSTSRNADEPATTQVRTESPEVGMGWIQFKNRTQGRLAAILSSLPYLTGESQLDGLNLGATAEWVYSETESEIGRLGEIEAQGGVDSCFADAAAAYSRAIFALSTSMSHAARSHSGEGQPTMELANDFYADAMRELNEWERLIPVADNAC